MERKIAVIGAGGWGTALAVSIAKKGLPVDMWVREEEVLKTIAEKRENEKFLPGIEIPAGINVSNDFAIVLSNKKYIFLTVPAQAIRSVTRQISQYLLPGAVLVSAAKGIELETLKLMSEVLEEELPKEKGITAAILSGPNHAEEVGRMVPSGTVISCPDEEIAREIQEVLASAHLRPYTNKDVIGVEIGGALKNIIALGAGISDGLGFGDNTKAALMTRGLAEIARLGIALGANPLTFAGLSGLGDLIVTCASQHSRNRRAGIKIAEGKTLDKVIEEMNGMVVEGVYTTQAAYQLAKKSDVRMPITEMIHSVLFGNKDPREGVIELMTRGQRSEQEEVILGNVLD